MFMNSGEEENYNKKTVFKGRVLFYLNLFFKHASFHVYHFFLYPLYFVFSKIKLLVQGDQTLLRGIQFLHGIDYSALKISTKVGACWRFANWLSIFTKVACAGFCCYHKRVMWTIGDGNCSLI